ncbi:uncharacterized protein LOC130711652 [Lotus japonicus]|uniref:uncharacterized protein LOC130711652 n=1 Tax=Lotus japonicus TaxID=34305 RepID=UPI00258F8B3B|nr:uncharacterized protein LOC130711652 [Lotus japonicus]
MQWGFLGAFFPSLPPGHELYYIFTRQPDHGVKDLKAYCIGILSNVLGSDDAAEGAYLFHNPTGFFAYFPLDKADLLQEHPSVIQVCPQFKPFPSPPGPAPINLSYFPPDKALID